MDKKIAKISAPKIALVMVKATSLTRLLASGVTLLGGTTTTGGSVDRVLISFFVMTLGDVVALTVAIVASRGMAIFAAGAEAGEMEVLPPPRKTVARTPIRTITVITATEIIIRNLDMLGFML